MKSGPAKLVLALLVMLAVGQAVYYYPRLPERASVHFGASGRANAQASKQVLLGVYLGAVGLVTLLLVALSSRIGRGLEPKLRFPNKDYWLEPARRQATLDYLSRHFLWFASATLALLVDIFHQVFQVNLGLARALDHPRLSLGLYVGFAVIWSIVMGRRFRLP